MPGATPKTAPPAVLKLVMGTALHDDSENAGPPLKIQGKKENTVLRTKLPVMPPDAGVLAVCGCTA